MDIKKLADIAEIEFSEIVEGTSFIPNRLRIFLKEGSYIDLWYSRNIKGRYAYHWERNQIDGSIYRHNNAPHKRWANIETFPKHFHEGAELNVKESRISDIPEMALKEFLTFVLRKINPGQE